MVSTKRKDVTKRTDTEPFLSPNPLELMNVRVKSGGLSDLLSCIVVPHSTQLSATQQQTLTDAFSALCAIWR